MSGKPGSRDTVGKAPSSASAQAGVATQSQGAIAPTRPEIFDVASQIEALLQGHSNKSVSKILTMVGSLHSLRVIPADRPIGQSTTGTVKNGPKQGPQPRKAKGQPTPLAAWKQTDDYRQLSAERESLVARLKTTDSATSAFAEVKTDLRRVEESIRQLKKRSAGDQ